MKTLLFSLLVLSSVSAFALDCDETISMQEMKACEQVRLDVQDARLNKVYNDLRKNEDNVGKLKLKNAQTAWIAFRNTECEYYSDGERGGTNEGLLTLLCHTSMTSKRASELEEYLASK
jgi:uncharacterized protein YecT (DUF1311 family)